MLSQSLHAERYVSKAGADVVGDAFAVFVRCDDIKCVGVSARPVKKVCNSMLSAVRVDQDPDFGAAVIRSALAVGKRQGDIEGQSGLIRKSDPALGS